VSAIALPHTTTEWHVYLLAVFCFVLLLFAVFMCTCVFLFFATTSLVNKDLYISRSCELEMSACNVNITSEILKKMHLQK